MADETKTDGGEDIEVEENSGIEFPGESMEPLLGSALRMNQLNQNKSTVIVIEFREKSNE